jgi:hypothetical protein
MAHAAVVIRRLQRLGFSRPEIIGYIAETIFDRGGAMDWVEEQEHKESLSYANSV